MNMEKKLTSKELLNNLIVSANDPFATVEKIEDIKKILSTSKSFSGINHLILVKSYLEEGITPIKISKEEAIVQCNLAIEEGNDIGYFYLYKLEDDEIKKRQYLNILLIRGYPKAYLEYAKLHHKGILYKKDLNKAYQYYRKAADKNLKDGYFGMIMVDIETNNLKQQKKDYEEALQKGFKLPGIIS